MMIQIKKDVNMVSLTHCNDWAHIKNGGFVYVHEISEEMITIFKNFQPGFWASPHPNPPSNNQIWGYVLIQDPPSNNQIWGYVLIQDANGENTRWSEYFENPFNPESLYEPLDNEQKLG